MGPVMRAASYKPDVAVLEGESRKNHELYEAKLYIKKQKKILEAILNEVDFSCYFYPTL